MNPDELLSQKEIDDLLSGINIGGDESNEKDFSNYHKICVYDFRRPISFTRNTINMFATMYEAFSHELTAKLSERKNTTITVHIISVDELLYEEFIKSLPFPSLAWKITAQNIKYPIVAELDPTIADQFCNLPDVKYITDLFCAHWNRTLPHEEFFVSGWQRDPTLIGATEPSDKGVLIMFQIKFNKYDGMLNIFIPSTLLGASWSFPKLLNKMNADKTEIDDSEKSGGTSMNEKITVVLGETVVPVDELKNAREGTTLSLSKLVGEPVDVYAGNTCFAKAEVVVIDDNFGIRLTELLQNSIH